jgi:hypothetical protein
MRLVRKKRLLQNDFKLIGIPGLVADAEDTAYGPLQQSGRQLRTCNFSIKLGSTHSSP